MPLYPKYQPVFSEAEIHEATKISRRHTSGQAQAKRAKLVLLLSDHPQRTSPDCARELKLHEQTVRKWRKRWCEEEFSLDDKPRCGRNWDFSPSTESVS